MLILPERESEKYFRKHFIYKCTPVDARGRQYEDESDYYDPTTPRSIRFDEIAEWCTEKWGDYLVHRNKDYWDLETGKIFTKIYIDETCRWSYGTEYFVFREEADAIAFRLRWPCTFSIEKD